MASTPSPIPDPKYKYTIHHIPSHGQSSTTPAVLEKLVQKFKQTKLIALEAEPDAFAVKHADEVLHSLEVWNQRVAGLSTVLICVATPVDIATSTSAPNIQSGSESGFTSTSEPDTLQSPSPSAATPTLPQSNPNPVAKDTGTDTEALLNPTSHWIGMATIRGPLPWSTYHLPLSDQPIPDDPEAETKWHLCNVYTSASHRNRGLARQLCAAAIAHAIAHTQSLNQSQTGDEEVRKMNAARVRLFCDPTKTYLVSLYKKMGFEEAGNCTLREAFVANGDGELVPRDTDSSEALRYKWERRYGLAMERLCEV